MTCQIIKEKNLSNTDAIKVKRKRGNENFLNRLLI